MSNLPTLPAIGSEPVAATEPVVQSPAPDSVVLLETVPPPALVAGPKLPHSSTHEHHHGVPEALTWLMGTIIVALFVLTFLAQPMVIPSESMERTLLVGDFLLMNRSALAPPGIWRPILPYSDLERGEIVTFHYPLNPRVYLVKRVIGLPGDRLRIDNGKIFVNGQLLSEPYAAFEPIPPNPYLDHFPSRNYTDAGVDPEWWKQMQQNTHDGELVVPAGKYFMMGDNRNHSRDSRYWGFVPRSQIVARPLVIYFSLARPSQTDVQQASDDRLSEERRGQEPDLSTRWMGFARWRRIFHVVH